MFIHSWRLFRIGGIEIRADWTFIFSITIFYLFLSNNFAETLPLSIRSPLAVFLCSALTALLIYSSLLAHELAHAVVSNRHGAPVGVIVFFMLGAAAGSEKDIESAGGEFKMAIAGPLASLVIAGAAYGLSFIVAAYGLSNYNPLFGYFSNQEKYFPVIQILKWVGWINILIAVFNLIPAFPMDGGRVLRAGLWRLTGDKMKSTAASVYLAMFIGTLGLISPFFFGFQMFYIAIFSLFIIFTALRTFADLKHEKNKNNEENKN